MILTEDYANIILTKGTTSVSPTSISVTIGYGSKDINISKMLLKEKKKLKAGVGRKKGTL